MIEEAPLHADVAESPEGGRAHWIRAADGTRIRIAVWNPDAEAGTILLFTGRTEYIEKYGRALHQIVELGYAVLVVDWRGQGLSQRSTDDQNLGDVADFEDFQMDVDAVVAAADALGLPGPRHLLAHSMGAAIGLLALMRGLPVRSVAFTSPMWGIRMDAHMKPFAWALSWMLLRTGQGLRYTPSIARANYVLERDFEHNGLTRNREMFEYLRRQMTERPELGIGGPSVRWLYNAMRYTLWLSKQPPPDLPCMLTSGTDESIVDIERTKRRIAGWPGATIDFVERGRHELMMEGLDVRGPLIEKMGAFFRSHS